MKAFTVIFIILIATLGHVNSGCNKYYLRWAPGQMKRIFMTYLNKVNCPRWTTRHSLTKRPINTGKLVLPRDVPFAMACGACFASSSTTTNLTLHTTGIEAKMEALLSSTSSAIHRVSDYKDCLVSYIITAPVSGNGGTFNCEFNRVRLRQVVESRSFRVSNVPVDKQLGETIILTKKDERASLQCRDPSLSDLSTIVYVWYTDAGQTPSELFLAATLRRNITFSPNSTGVHNVSCASYDIYNPRKVWKITYTIEDYRADENRIQEGHGIDGQPQTQNDNRNKSAWLHNPLVWIGTVAAFVLVVGIVISMGLCKCSPKNKTTPQSRRHSQTKQNDLHWIPRDDPQEP